MRRSVSVSIALVMLVFVSLAACSAQPGLSAGDIKTVQFWALDPEGGTKWMASEAEVARFVDAYRQARRLSDYGETTAPARIDDTLNGGEQLVIWGGELEFQTVKWQGEQYNIQGEELRALLADIAKRK